MSNKPIEDKRNEAKARQEAYNKLTPKQKLDLLDKKLGKDIGAKRQRERLKKIIG